MPLVTQFDSKSWFYSCEIVSFLILSKYSGRVIQFNDIVVDNLGHCWDDKESKPKDSVSQYIGGVTQEGLKEIKEFMIEKYGKQPELANSLFHNDIFKRYIYVPKGTYLIKTILKYLLKFKLRPLISLIKSVITNLLFYNYPKNLEIDEKLSWDKKD